jgi:ABC-type multidrug transport system fused ATPase/permease subunit
MQVDHFKEEVIKRKKRGLFNLLLTLVTILMIAAGIAAALFFAAIQRTLFTSQFSISNIIMFIFFALILIGLFYIRVNMRLEYEYAFTNGILDVDKVVNNTKRKHLLSVDMRKITIMAPVEDARYAGYDGDKLMKRTYAVINRYSQIYFIVFGEEGKEQMLLLEPSREMVEMMRYYNAKNIIPAREPNEV